MKLSNTLFVFFVVAVAVVTLGTTAQAQLLNENFDYTAGLPLNGTGGWSAHSGAGTNSPVISTGGLSYVGYPSSGIGNAVAFTTNGEDNNRSYASFPNGTSSGSLYYSLLVRIDSAAATGDYFFHLLKTSSTFSARIFAKRASNGNIQFGIGKTSTIANINFSDSIYTTGTTYLLVVKYTVIAGATNDTVALWVNPTIGATEPTPTVLESVADRAGADQDTVYGVAIRQGSAANAPIGTVDGIRVGTSWGLVVAGIQPPLSGTKTIGGASPDYATIKGALNDLTARGTEPPGVTFVIRDGTYNEDTLIVRTSTSSASAPITFKPDAGANVVIRVTPPNTSTPFGIKIDSTSYVTIDGSNNGTTSRNLTINAGSSNMQKGVWISGQSYFSTLKNCIVYTGGITSSYRGIDLLYTTAVGGNPNNCVIENNLVKNAYFGIRTEGNSATDLINNLTIKNNTFDSISTYGMYIFYTFYADIYNNDIHLVGTSTLYGSYINTTTLNVRYYNNKIHDLTTTGTTSVIYGIYIVGTSTLAQHAVFNNFIWNFNPPTAGTQAMYGIYHSTANTSIADTVAYNTVNLSQTTTGNKTTYAYYRSSSTGPAYLYNNILKNTRTDGTTGIAYGVYKTSTSSVLLSNNNDIYVGTPDAQHMTGRISTTNYSTLADWRTANSSDAASVAADPPFVSATDLHMQTTVPTQLESGATPIAGIAKDIDGDTRNVTAPDIGADEFAGIALDLTPPVITYTPLAHTPLIGARTLTASIADASGVPTAGIGLPVLYWKKNSGAYTSATGSFVSGSNYSFTFGAGTAVGDTVSYYVAAQDNAGTPNVGVQPSAGAGGLTANPPAAATPPTSPSFYYIAQQPLAAGDYTVGLTLFESVIGKKLTAQTFTRRVMKEVPVGPEIDHKATGGNETTSLMTPFLTTEFREVEESYAVLMENGRPYDGVTRILLTDAQRGVLGLSSDVVAVYPTITAAVNDLNLRGVSGSVRFLLNDATYPTETFPITINVASDSIPNASKTVTIKPNVGVTATVAGASASGPIFKVFQTNYVTIDGSNATSGTTRDLTLQNTSTTSPQVVLFGSSGTTPITNGMLKNCVVINGANSSSAVIISDGVAAGTQGYFNTMTVQNNDIRNAYIGVYTTGGTVPQTGFNVSYLNNTVNDASMAYVGLYMQGVDGATISQNDIGSFNGATSQDDKAIWLATGTINAVVGRNKIHDLNYTGTGGYGGHGVYVTTGQSPANIAVANNMISHLSGDGWNYTSIPTDNTIGIAFSGTQTSVGAYYNSINLYGNTLNKASALSMGIYLGAGSVADLKNNLIVNTLGRLDTSSAGLGYGKAGVYAATANTQFSGIDYNDYYVNTEPNAVSALGKISTTDYLTIADWRTGSGGDVHSISANVTFLAPTDLHIDSTSTPAVSNVGTPITGITTDFDGQTRNIATPDIGADEFGLPSVTLNGSYTVGTGGQFATLADAFTALQTNGVSGPVTLLLTDTDYDVSGSVTSGDGQVAPPRPRGMVDPLDPLYTKGSLARELVQTDNPDTVGALTLLGPITGASGTNRITIRPATGTAATITGNGGWVLNLLNASYVTIDGIGLAGSTRLTINSTALGSVGLLLRGNSDNNMIQNVTVRAPFANSTTVYLLADSATATPDNNVIQNNVIASGTDGVDIIGNATSFPDGNWISNNMIGTPTDSIGQTGVYVQQAFNTRINGNRIQNVRQVFTNIAGIWVATKHLGTRIWNNVIHNVKLTPTTTAAGFASGMYIFGTSTDTTNGDYYNNMVYDLDYLGTFTGGTVRGMYVSTGRLDTIAYNSIYLTGTATTNVTSGALYTSTHVGQVFRNNIAINNRTEMGTGRGMAFYKLSTTSTINSNYNDLYVPVQPNSFIGGVGTSNDTTLAKWRARGYDSMSVSTTANFQAPDLHINSTIPTPLDGGGTPVAGITTDFDGQTRNAATPDIGADEFTVVLLPPPVISSVGRSTLVPFAGDTLVVTCTITDTLGITSANLLYASDGVAQTPVPMVRTSGTPTNGTYRGVLPGSANQNGKRIEYRIQANSSTGNTTTTSVVAANSYYAGISPLSLSGLRRVDTNGRLIDSLYYARVTGTVNGPNFQTTNLGYHFQDAVGGIQLFSFGINIPPLSLGDSIMVVGRLLQFRGLTEITPDTQAAHIQVVATGRTVTPITVSVPAFNANPELYESRLVRLTSLQRLYATPPWPTAGLSANIVMYQSVVADSIIMRIDSDTQIPGTPEPAYPVSVTGVISQFTSATSVYNDGYQTQPRYVTDFTSALPNVGWTTRGSGTTSFLQSVKQVNASISWAAGNGGTVRRSIDYGATWTNANPGANPSADIYCIDALDANTAFISTSPGGTFIYRTTNGGTNWVQVYNDPATTAFINAIHMYDASNGIAVGDPVGGKFTILKTSDGGATWARIPTEPTPTPSTETGINNSLATVGTNNIWFGSSLGPVWRSTDAGVTWSRVATTFTTNNLEVHFNDANYGVTGSTAAAARTTNGGVSWFAMTVPGTGNLNGLSGSGYEFFASKGTSVYRSTDRGATWTSSFTGAIGTLAHLDFFAASNKFYGTTVSQTGGIATAFLDFVTGVEEENSEIPSVYSLAQNYPNPFNPSTTIRFGLPEQSAVTLKIYNILGQEVVTLVNGEQAAGHFSITWNGRNQFGSQVASGVYFYRIEAKPTSGKQFTSLKKMILLK